MSDKIKRIIKSKKLNIALIITLDACVLACTFLLIFTLAVNLYVKQSVNDEILDFDEATKLDGVDCILVLGCGVWGDSPSHLLADRLEKGIGLYQCGVAPKLLMSGDHGRYDYNEVSVMKQYAMLDGISSEDIFMDHAGFSTYESMYRAKEIFGVDKMVIVTQEYHLSRAVYIANSLGIEAYGVAADYREYSQQPYWSAREVLARVKDFAYSIFKPLPTYLGESIDISGNGDVTNDGHENFDVFIKTT